MFSNSPVLQIKDFRLLFLTRIFVSMALQAQAVIVGWQVYQMSKDPLLLGLIGLTEAVPAITCSFFSGHIVDNNRPAAVYRLCILTLLLNAVLIWFAASSVFQFSDHLRLILIFAGIFGSGAARSFSSPSISSLIPRIVPRNLLSAAAAFNSSSFQIAAILGPAFGGLVYGRFGATIAFAIPPVILMIAFVSSEFLSKPAKALRATSTREPFLKSIQSGVKFALGQKVLLSTMILDMFSVLFGGAVAVLPIFADKVLHSGSFGLGLLRAAPSVGSGIVVLILAFRPMKVISGKTLLWVVAGFGLSNLLFALSTNFTFALLFLALGGAFDGISMVIRQTIEQLLAPDHMRGRIAALGSIFITSSNEIGAFESGLAARFMGLVPSVVFGGAMTLVVVSATAWLVPGLRKTRIGPEPDPSEA